MIFDVNLQPSGHQFKINDDESILDAALNQGISLPYGCRNGACGSCAARLVSGTVDYGDRNHSGLSEQDQEKGVVLCCQAHATSDLEIQVQEISGTAEIKPKIMPARVVKLEKLAHDVMQLELKLPESQRMQFLAGQYIEVLLQGGKRRAFSIANAPHQDDVIVLQIRHVPDGYFSNVVFEQMKEKALLRIEGPFGSFFLREDSDRPIIMLGGGTGFAPLKGMLDHAIALCMKNNISLYCGVRAKRDLYMQEQVADIQKLMPQLDFHPVLSEPDAADNWQGETGFVHEAVMRQFDDLSGFDIYISGPPPMVNAAKNEFSKKGALLEHMFSDSFEYSADAKQQAE